MKLVMHWVDMRGGYGSKQTWESEIVDKETNKPVGFVRQENKPAERYVSLFGGKYTGKFTTPDECFAFVRGVQAVLNHVTELPEAASERAA